MFNKKSDRTFYSLRVVIGRVVVVGEFVVVGGCAEVGESETLE